MSAGPLCTSRVKYSTWCCVFITVQSDTQVHVRECLQMYCKFQIEGGQNLVFNVVSNFRLSGGNLQMDETPINRHNMHIMFLCSNSTSPHGSADMSANSKGTESLCCTTAKTKKAAPLFPLCHYVLKGKCKRMVSSSFMELKQYVFLLSVSFDTFTELLFLISCISVLSNMKYFLL